MQTFEDNITPGPTTGFFFGSEVFHVKTLGRNVTN